MSKKLTDFINSERFRFETRDNNIFSLVFSEIVRYRNFLTIITEHYKMNSQNFIKNSKALQKTIVSGTSTFTPAQEKLYAQGRDISTELHLDIEAFYLFAKILLDKLSRAVEFYFGGERSLSLKSHDAFVKNIEKYSRAKKLKLNKNFVQLAVELKQDISDFRDYQISHLQSPRTMRGTMYDPTGDTKLILTSLYPTEKDRQYNSRAVTELLNEVDEYSGYFIHFMKVNRKKTNLRIDSSRSGKVIRKKLLN